MNYKLDWDMLNRFHLRFAAFFLLKRGLLVHTVVEKGIVKDLVFFG